MKTFVRISIVGVLLSFLFFGSAMADPVFYAGVKVGQMKVDVAGLDDAANGGILVGYQFFNGLAFEAEYTTSISDGDIEGFGGTWDVSTFAVYFVSRTSGNIYFKSKIGHINEDVTIDFGGYEESSSDTGLSVGLGLGFRVAEAGIFELEYTVVEEDINFISFGYNHYF